MKTLVAWVLVLCGAGLLVAAAALWSPTAGLALGGLFLLVTGLIFTDIGS